MGKFRPAALVAILSVILLGLAVGVATMLHLPALQPVQWSLFAACTALNALSYIYPLRLGRDEPIPVVLSSAFLMGAAFVLPPAYLSLICLLMIIPGGLGDDREDRWLRAAFNATSYLLVTQLFAMLVSISGVRYGFEAWHFPVLLLAMFVDVAGGAALVGLVLALDAGLPIWKVQVWDSRSLGVEILISTLGVLLGVLLLFSPWAALLALVPLVLPYWLLRDISMVRMVDIDPKTGLYNHRYFQYALREKLAHSRAAGRPMSVLFADMDYLREINNRYGHLAGDRVLRQVADVLMHNTRPGDLVARWGGEEFVVILPGTTVETATEVAARLCSAIADHDFDLGEPEPLRCTISVGVAEAQCHGWDPDLLLHIADQAMYRAKTGGRNQVRVAPLVAPSQQ